MGNAYSYWEAEFECPPFPEPLKKSIESVDAERIGWSVPAKQSVLLHALALLNEIHNPKVELKELPPPSDTDGFKVKVSGRRQRAAWRAKRHGRTSEVADWAKKWYLLHHKGSPTAEDRRQVVKMMKFHEERKKNGGIPKAPPLQFYASVASNRFAELADL